MDRRDQIERVPLGLRWIDDAFAVAPHAGGLAMRLVDMTNARAALRVLRDGRIPATTVHLVVRASALVLARNPHLHRMACNYQRLTPGTVDIGLSMAGHTTYAPVVVLTAADSKPLSELVPTILAAVDAAGEKEEVDLRNMKNLMWMIPFGIIRRFILRLLNNSTWFRRRIVGTFQISMLPRADVCVPMLFYTGSMLATGAVRDRVVAIDGQPVVRPTMWLSLVIDHAAMDGVLAEQLLEGIRELLEGDELMREAREACEAKRAASSAAALPPAPASEPGVAPSASAVDAARPGAS
jgi:hypothetical protein